MMEYMNVAARAASARRTAPRSSRWCSSCRPFAPHIAEELWEQLGHTGSMFDAGWPAFDAALAAEEHDRRSRCR